ncbi:hypothetical protein AB0G02_01750 [Actinosynnema sp. NPDC023658]|uniref:hypothetical protein n=1 Tax=Actinosynnema sp. NPDC023658 TaxID=3155465 RepID=UPI0033F1676E
MLALVVSGIFTAAGAASADPPGPCGFYSGTNGKYVVNCVYGYVKYRIYFALGSSEDRCLEPKEWYAIPTTFAPYAADKLGAC